MDRLYRDFGQRVRATRSGAGMSQEELGAKIGLSRTSITNVERGAQRIQLHTICRIAKALNVGVITLIPDLSLLEPAATRELPALRELPKLHREWVQRVVIAPSRVARPQREGE